MLYYGVFHATVDEKRESPIAVVVTDEDGTVTTAAERTPVSS